MNAGLQVTFSMSDTLQRGIIIEETFYSKPYYGVRGIVMALMDVRGKRKCIAHATVYSDQAPAINLRVPKSLQLDQIDKLADALKSFAAKVKSHSQE